MVQVRALSSRNATLFSFSDVDMAHMKHWHAYAVYSLDNQIPMASAQEVLVPPLRCVNRKQNRSGTRGKFRMHHFK